MLRNVNNLKLIIGVLYRDIKSQDGIISQLVTPKQFISTAFTGLHYYIGHPGKDRTLSLMQERFVWPEMNSDAENWDKICDRCLGRKSSCHKAPIVNITSSYPLELVYLDYLFLEPCKGGIINILVTTDHYTTYAQGIPTKNHTARTTAEAFYSNFIVHYGIPARLHSDQCA
jgi:hypothetical protein